MVAADIAACLGFFTRLPLPARTAAARRLRRRAMGGAAGRRGGRRRRRRRPTRVGACWLSCRRRWPRSPRSASAAGDRRLHEDGLADTADGFGGGNTRERKLEIMRDSRIGTFGWCAGDDAARPLGGDGRARRAGLVLLALIAAHAASRALLPAFMRIVPPGPPRRPVGRRRHGARQRRARLAAGARRAGPAAARPRRRAIAAASASACCSLALKWLAESQIGGQTGDVLGALQQGAEIDVLFVAASHFS